VDNSGDFEVGLQFQKLLKWLSGLDLSKRIEELFGVAGENEVQINK